MIIMSCPGPHKPAGEGGMDMTTEAFRKVLDIRLSQDNCFFFLDYSLLITLTLLIDECSVRNW
jgi:hypothetical protein